MKTTVITGSTRGIGHGLAKAFLARNCAVTISGRSLASVEEAVEALVDEHYDPQRILGQPCDVTDIDQVLALWDAAYAHFGKIDIWINNAGIAHPQVDFWQHPPERIRAVVETNLLGVMHGVKVALPRLIEQSFGQLYNMEGLGSNGRRVAGMTLYGTTKYGVRYLTDSLVKETRETPVIVGALSPGMVITDLITKQYEDRPAEEWQQARRIFNILADRVETVTPWMAEKILANDQHGERISWLTPTKIAWRFLTAPFRQRDLFD